MSTVFITRREYDLLIHHHSDYMAVGWDAIKRHRTWHVTGCTISIPDPAPQWVEELRVRVENVRRILAELRHDRANSQGLRTVPERE